MPGFLSKLIGGSAAEPIEAVGNVFDKLFTSDEERAAADQVMEKLRQHPGELQVQLNKVEAGHRSVFVAGWRPYIGWVCGTSLAIYFIPQYTMATYIWVKLVLATNIMQPYPVTADGLMELVFAMLGMGALRTVEKLQGRAK